jgi:hypothetical protein
MFNKGKQIKKLSAALDAEMAKNNKLTNILSEISAYHQQIETYQDKINSIIASYWEDTHNLKDDVKISNMLDKENNHMWRAINGELQK